MESNYQIKTRLERSEKKITYKHLGILEASTIKQVEMKKNLRKHRRRTRKLLETKLCSRNLIKRINTWAVSYFRYSAPLVKWTREVLKQMDQRIKKLMTMHKALYPREDDDRLYVSRKEGGKWLASNKDCWRFDTKTQSLHWKARSGRITAMKKDTDNTMTNIMTITRGKNKKKNNSMGVLNDWYATS